MNDTFLEDWGVAIAGVAAVLAVLYGALTARQLLTLSPGNARMQEISAAVQEGARAYLNRQYLVIGLIAIPLFFLVVVIQEWDVAIGFLIGGAASAAAGFIGMNVSVRANARVAEAARGGISKALDVAFRGGAVTGMLVAGLALGSVAGYYAIVHFVFDTDVEGTTEALIGLGFGGSLISVFARLGGGIFTKAADVGADLVGKVEAGIPEDDPRNPAVIADNVGDNVGDCAGMAADLFETYVVSAVAVMFLGVLLFGEGSDEAVAVYPMLIGAVSLVASIIGAFAVRTTTGNVERALYQGLFVAAVISAGGFLLVTLFLMDDLTLETGVAAEGAISYFLAALIGVGVTALLFFITDYYTSTRFAPVKKTAAASQTGHATNIIQGLAQGMQATAAPAIVIALAILGAWQVTGGGEQGIYGIGVAVMAMLGLAGMIVALDAFGPITDNAGGIAEMAELPEDVRNVTDPLDAVGNTTKAVTKGYAIGSAALAALVLFDAFRLDLVEELRAAGACPEEAGGTPPAGVPGGTEAETCVAFPIDEPAVLIGLLIGGLMVNLFASLSMEAVGRAGGAVVEEVRRQFRENPGIMEGTQKPDYARSVGLVTGAAQREMILPSLIPVLIPVIVGVISEQALGGLLIGVIIVGFFYAVSMTSGGGAWDNAKKLIEDGNFGGKGSEAHAASVTGDTVGDPYKDTAGPAINPMIKVANIVAILIIPLIV